MVYRVCILTVSTKGSRGERTDESGERLAEMVMRLPAEVVGRALVSDEVPEIRKQVHEWLKAVDPHLILLTRRTGPGPPDVTPQAPAPLLDYAGPGLGDGM